LSRHRLKNPLRWSSVPSQRARLRSWRDCCLWPRPCCYEAAFGLVPSPLPSRIEAALLQPQPPPPVAFGLRKAERPGVPPAAPLIFDTYTRTHPSAIVPDRHPPWPPSAHPRRAHGRHSLVQGTSSQSPHLGLESCAASRPAPAPPDLCLRCCAARKVHGDGPIAADICPSRPGEGLKPNWHHGR
jgi:hypothetical protein